MFSSKQSFIVFIPWENFYCHETYFGLASMCISFFILTLARLDWGEVVKLGPSNSSFSNFSTLSRTFPALLLCLLVSWNWSERLKKFANYVSKHLPSHFVNELSFGTILRQLKAWNGGFLFRRYSDDFERFWIKKTQCIISASYSFQSTRTFSHQTIQHVDNSSPNCSLKIAFSYILRIYSMS